MKRNNGNMQVSLLALAVQGALIAMCAMPAHADDEEVAALKKPTNSVEIGAASVSQSSAKFGEYNGMNKSGVDAVGNVNLRGGDAYGDSNGTNRWSIIGKDLGLTSRSAGAALSNQGQWNIGIGYDQLQHNISDTYQTPYLGAMGNNNFTLPAGFGLISTAASGLSPVGTNAMTAAQQAAFHQLDIASTRKNTSFTAGVNLDRQWDVKFDFNRLNQSGAKLESFGSMLNATKAPGVLGEAISVLANPTNYQTDTINLALNWIGDQAHMTTSYFGSFFREGYDRVNFQTYGATTRAIATTGTASVMETMNTPPSNQFHQLNMNGGYVFSPKTKLTGGFSFARNTQNDPFVADAYSMVTAPPQATLSGQVNNYHADLKLTDQTFKDWALSAGMKYDERNDHTVSNFYRFNALDGAANHVANFPNTPFSNRKTQLELAGDYRLDESQHLRFAYNRENIKRWCDQYAIGGTGVALTTAAGNNTYPAGTNCVVATDSHDDKLSGTYKINANEDLNMNVGYSYSKRVTASDPNAITARIGLNGNPNLANAAVVGNTLIQGLNAGDFLGFYPYFDASRREQMLKAGANWQAREKLSLGAGLKYTDDKYDSLYGVKNGNSWSVNLDATYSYSEHGSVSAYATQQHKQRDMTDLYRSLTTAAGLASATALNIPSGATWSDTQKDIDTTVGLSAKQTGLMDAKLELNADLTFTLGKTGYNTQFNYAAATTTGLTCASPQFMTCGSLPEINNQVVQVKLSGKYKLDKSSKVVFGYTYQQMKSNDYYYNGLQMGYTPTALMPTYQQSPNYTVNMIAMAYLLEF